MQTDVQSLTCSGAGFAGDDNLPQPPDARVRDQEGAVLEAHHIPQRVGEPRLGAGTIIPAEAARLTH